MKELLGGLSVAVGAYAYIPYARNIAKGKTKPHAFSWLIWVSMSAIAFAAQLTEGGKAGSWAMGFTAAACGGIFIAALFLGEKNITRSDWACLLGAVFAVALWIVTDGPLLSVILITIIDFLGYIPTFRKSYWKPYEETVTTYVLSGIKFVLAILALDVFSVTTVLYPLSIVLTNTAFIWMVMVRRAQLDRNSLSADSTALST